MATANKTKGQKEELIISPSVYISAQTLHGIDNASWYVLNYLHLLLS